jgi:FKBP-type peptidyl-prolyl cis-trans isomerase
MMRAKAPALACLAASVSLSCGAATFQRETVATNARIDDPWFEGERCQAGVTGEAEARTEELEVGIGKPVGDGQTVRVHYVARLPDGTVVHDTRQDSAVPLEVIIGSTKVICGFERALLGMRAGGQRRVTVPWRLAFGEAGKPPAVPPKTDVLFVIDLYLPAAPSLEDGMPPRGPARGRGR